MTAPHSIWMVKRAALARLPEGHPAAASLRTELGLDRAADYIARIMADAPPLNDEQRTRLAELLKPVRRQPGRSDLGGAA